MVRTLGGAARKVNAATLVLLIFSAPVFAAPKPLNYGRHLIETTAGWLPEYIDQMLMRVGYIPKLYPAPQDPFQDVAEPHKRYAQMMAAFLAVSEKLPPFVFRQGNDPIFVLNPAEAPRRAVTRNGMNEPVYFNLDRISDFNTFTYADALALWIHELGHKVKIAYPHLKLTQDEIDQAGSALGKYFAALMRVHEAGGFKILTLLPIPQAEEGSLYRGPVRRLRYPTTFAVLHNGHWLDFSVEFEKQLDALKSPHVKYMETVRRVLNVLKLKESGEDIELRLELRTARHVDMVPDGVPVPITQMGPNHFRSVRLKVPRDFSKLEFSRYIDEPYPNELIHDGQIDLGAIRISTDRKTLFGDYKLILQNQTHFHAAGYPSSYAKLLALLDGEPVQLEVRVAWRMRDYPPDAFKKETVKFGTFSLDISELQGKELEIIGVIERFFTHGRYTSPNEEFKRLRLSEPVFVELPDCAGVLQP